MRRANYRPAIREFVQYAIAIGTQTIMPKTGPSPRQTPPPQPGARETDSAAPPKQALPPPGVGKLVDKTA